MIKFAVLGCGRIGRMHALNLARHPRVELASVYDVVDQAAAATAEATGARRAGAIDEILGAREVDAVLIASSTDTHLDLLVRAVEAGKAVLCEKPIDLDLAKVDASWARIQDRRPTIMVGFNRRFDASFKALRDRIQAGEIGKLEQVVITSRDPGPPPIAYIEVSGGLFRDMTIHDFDMARYLMGDIETVHAIGAHLVDPAIRQAGDIDAAMVTLVAKSGTLCQISNSRRCAYGYDQRIEAFGGQGHAPGRQSATDHGLLLGCCRNRGTRPGSALFHRALHAGLSCGDRSLRRLRREGHGTARRLPRRP